MSRNDIDRELAGMVVKEALRFAGVILLVALTLLSVFLVPSLIAHSFAALGDPADGPLGSALGAAAIVGALVWGWRAVLKWRQEPPG